MAHPLMLVVEDDILVRLNTDEIFADAGFEVMQAGDAAATGLAVLQANSDISLVCTDVHMPGELNRLDLAIHIRAHYPNTKVIVVSGVDRTPAHPPGIAFLTKPIPPKHLVDIACEHLRGNSREGEGPSCRAPSSLDGNLTPPTT